MAIDYSFPFCTEILASSNVVSFTDRQAKATNEILMWMQNTINVYVDILGLTASNPQIKIGQQAPLLGKTLNKNASFQS